MSSTTGKVENNTGLTLTFSSGGVSHGNNPDFYQTSLAAGDTAAIFIAHSDGAGVEGTVNASGRPDPAFRFNSCMTIPWWEGIQEAYRTRRRGIKDRAALVEATTTPILTR